MAPADINSGDKKFASLLPSLSDEGAAVSQWIDFVYNSLQLDSLGLQKNVFFYACKGYEYLLSQQKLQKTSLLTICDYTQSSTHKRLYVIDMEKREVLYNTYVSHGKNSGNEFATSFSNKADSHKSSLGFMITGNTYIGRAGYSMCFDGIEKGINNNVKARSIVMHGSDYVNEERADEGSAMGRSYGCPAVPYNEHRKIIDAIKGGSCFFAYADDKLYASTSAILSARFNWPVTNSPQIPGKESITSDSNNHASQLITATL
ncbi:murein L,D-transpeptidase catalytic domain family protein [Panacibacter ginsenosidivorans]|uniref:Murein L,D-transpeptidase catalytic domain family protein n=2 Tax=Panacibacter ginsenosidivorans TaxID=1813871 RepID=A0A5B8VGW0_9BACT|nr:murein L,D-transpeptidase catalytic domain family protein [Panacibacter ginsenosidivorans]